MGEQKEEYSEMTAHTSGTAKGEETGAKDGAEEGRTGEENDPETDRPEGGSTARISTSINPEKRDPIDPESPHLPPA